MIRILQQTYKWYDIVKHFARLETWWRGGLEDCDSVSISRAGDSVLALDWVDPTTALIITVGYNYQYCHDHHRLHYYHLAVSSSTLIDFLQRVTLLTTFWSLIQNYGPSETSQGVFKSHLCDPETLLLERYQSCVKLTASYVIVFYVNG